MGFVPDAQWKCLKISYVTDNKFVCTLSKVKLLFFQKFIMSEASLFFEGEKVDNLDTWIPANSREKVFYSYLKKDGKEIVSRSRAFLTYPKMMKTGIVFIY